MTTPKSNNLIIIIIVVVVAALGYFFLTMPDQRTTGQKVGDAIDALPEGGPDKAVRELQDRTPGERLGDAVKDATDNEPQD